MKNISKNNRALVAANGICVHDDGTCRQRNGRRKRL